MSCAGDRLALTELIRESTRAVGKLRASTCTLEGCLTRNVGLPQVDFFTSSEAKSNDSAGFAVLLGERFLLVWWERGRTRFARSEAEERATLWMRLARLEDLGRAPSTALLDLETAKYWGSGSRAIPGSDTVTVVLPAKHGTTTSAFRVRRDGTVKWLRFVRAEPPVE
jgi:hypothetical protein